MAWNSPFAWFECGRQYVARFGRLSVSVRVMGSRAKGTRRYSVGCVFGNSFLGKLGPHKHLDDALAEAEEIAAREARALAEFFPGASDARREEG